MKDEAHRNHLSASTLPPVAGSRSIFPQSDSEDFFLFFHISELMLPPRRVTASSFCFPFIRCPSAALYFPQDDRRAYYLNYKLLQKKKKNHKIFPKAAMLPGDPVWASLLFSATSLKEEQKTLTPSVLCVSAGSRSSDGFIVSVATAHRKKGFLSFFKILSGLDVFVVAFSFPAAKEELC